LARADREDQRALLGELRFSGQQPDSEAYRAILHRQPSRELEYESALSGLEQDDILSDLERLVRHLGGNEPDVARLLVGGLRMCWIGRFEASRTNPRLFEGEEGGPLRYSMMDHFPRLGL
jgi:hypothetical protein